MVRRWLSRVLLTTGLALLLALAGCAVAPDPWQGLDAGNKKRVVVSFPPLYSFVKAVGGDHVAVICLCYTGPHEFKPDVQSSIVFRKANLLFSNGLGLDAYTDKLVGSGDNKQIRHVHLGDDLPHDLLLEGKDEDGKEEKGKEIQDPHVWLGTDEAVLMVNHIRDELTKLDPDHKDAYAVNAADYVKKLEALRNEYQGRLQGKKNRKLVSSHDALAYFQRTFKLDAVPIVETPEEEASATKLAQLIQTMHRDDIRVIAVEPGEANAHKSADTLLAGIKARDAELGKKVHIIDFDPLESADERELKTEGGEWYLKRMRHNLDTLLEALP